MTTLTLNAQELEVLNLQDPSTKGDGGFQSLMVTLQNLTDQETGVITIPPIVLNRIPKYAFDYRIGGWEDRLKAIFSRTLGPELGR
jgi:hypothetical protein